MVISEISFIEWMNYIIAYVGMSCVPIVSTLLLLKIIYGRGKNKKMLKCLFCKYKEVCRPEMEYKLARKKEVENFKKWYGNYKKEKEKDNENNT